jgi:calcineurin-like phosphoesterase family protein
MTSDPATFHNHFASIFQSAIDDLVRRIPGSAGLLSRPGPDNPLVRAAAQIAALHTNNPGWAIPSAPPQGVAQTVWDCAKLSYELLQAKLAGNASLADRIEDELAFNQCDPNWAEVIFKYLDYFGPDGSRAPIPYIRPAQVGPTVLALTSGSTIALIADWGTGTAAAINVLQEVARQKPDVLIHLGDIYYSGTPEECEANFRTIVERVLDRGNTRIPVFTLPGNHDMYSGGGGYYGLIAALNPPPMRQPASFFCLRSADAAWQFVAMDTALHDYDPFTVTEVLTYVEDEETDWIEQRIAEFPGHTILLSHHQPFSAFSQIGPAKPDGSLNPANPRLMAAYERFAAAAPGRIAAWFWGHEHRLCLYQPYRGIDKGRCIGDSAVPVFAASGALSVLDRLTDAPGFLPVTLGASDRVLTHGFTVIRLPTSAGPAVADYYQDTNGTTPIFSETL